MVGGGGEVPLTPPGVDIDRVAAMLSSDKGSSQRCHLSWLTNSALVKKIFLSLLSLEAFLEADPEEF
jgi:hypothetical protein